MIVSKFDVVPYVEEYLSVHRKMQTGAIPQMKLFSISLGAFAEISQTRVCWRRLLFIIYKFWYNISSVHTNSNKLAPKSRVLHPSQGHRERGLCVLRTSVKPITLRLICGFHIFLSSALIKQASFALSLERKATFLKEV